MKFFFLIFDNIRRNPVRTLLTSLGTMVMVLVVTLVFTVLTALDKSTTEKSANLKAIITEKWQVPSIMPYSYAKGLSEGAADPNDATAAHPTDSMTWGFFLGSTESNPAKRSFENLFFAFIMDPEKSRTMMDELDEMEDSQIEPLIQAIAKMKTTPNGVIVGLERLEKMKKKVGERFTAYGRNFKDINLELEIVGTFPKEPARFADSAIINRDYFNLQMEAYQREKNKPHPMAEKTLGLVWLRMKDKPTFHKVSEQIMTSPSFTNPAVKCETSSTGISGFLEAYRDIIWVLRWILTPLCLVVLSMVIANAINISVRERQMEFAVLKVLGFRPNQILMLVQGEALLVGTLSGLLCAALTYGIINGVWGGLPFRIAFFPKFSVPLDALWWGAAMGAATAFVGSFFPAWEARSVKVADVFARVT